jgi:hypothetical protein
MITESALQQERSVTVKSTNNEVKPTLLSVLNIYPIFNVLCSCLDTGGLITLKKISRQFASHLAVHKRERWNVNRRLKRFVRDPAKLRSMLGRYDALISGGFVIQFLDDILWPESDLDIYVEEVSILPEL